MSAERRLVVVDASVAIKWIFPEAGSDLAWLLRRNCSLIAPQLIHAECANIIWKKVRRGELSLDEAVLAGNFVDEFAVEVASLQELVSLAVELSLQMDHPAYDCFYLALAIVQGCPFVTADGMLYRKVRALLPGQFVQCEMLETFSA